MSVCESIHRRVCSWWCHEVSRRHTPQGWFLKPEKVIKMGGDFLSLLGWRISPLFFNLHTASVGLLWCTGIDFTRPAWVRGWGGVMCGKSEVGGWGGGECQSEWTGGKKGKIPWMWCPKVVRLHHYRGHLTLSIVSLINRRAEVVESIIRRPPGLSLPYFSFIHRWMLPASCCCCKSWSSLGGCQ